MHYDMILVMDKFTAADVMREVSALFTTCYSILPALCMETLSTTKTGDGAWIPLTCCLVQISVYDTINKHGKYTQKVRRLGEFHPILANAQESDGQDIDDPLYGNEGGEKEEVDLPS